MYGRYSSSYPHRSRYGPNEHSDYLNSRRFMPNPDYYSPRDGPRHQEREYHQHYDTRGHGFYSAPRHYHSERRRSEYHPSERERRHRPSHYSMDHLTSGFAGLDMDSGRSRRHRSHRDASSRNVHWHDQTMPYAPEVPRVMLPHQVQYSVDRASRGNSSYHDQYADATRYMNAQRSVPHVSPGGRHGHREDGHRSSRRDGHHSSHRHRRSSGQAEASGGLRDRIRRFF